MTAPVPPPPPGSVPPPPVPPPAGPGFVVPPGPPTAAPAPVPPGGPPPRRGVPIVAIVVGVVAAVLLLGVIAAVAGMNLAPAPTPGASVAQIVPTPTATEAATEAPTDVPTPDPTETPEPTDAPTPDPTPEPTAAPEPTPEPTETPEAWQEHSSGRFQYTIKYPPDWFVTKGDATHADQFDGFGYPYIYVSRDTVNGRVSTALTVADVIRTTKSHYKAKVTGNKAIRLAGGYTGRIITFKGVDEGVPITIQKIVVGKGREGYFLSLYADDETRQEGIDTFERMYRSWRPT